MQRITVPLRIPSVAGPYPWLRETFDTVLLSKNFSWQDLRHSKLDDGRRNNSMDYRDRVSVHLSMQYKFRCQLGDSQRQPKVLQRRESPASWIRCDRCLCRSGLTGAPYANSQYFGVYSYSANLIMWKVWRLQMPIQRRLAVSGVLLLGSM